MSTKWKITSSEHVDEVQDKAHTQAQGKHAQASAGHENAFSVAARSARMT